MNYHLQTALNKECTHSRTSFTCIQLEITVQDRCQRVFRFTEHSKPTQVIPRPDWDSWMSDSWFWQCSSILSYSFYHCVFLWIISCNKNVSFLKVFAHCIQNFRMHFIYFFHIHHRNTQKRPTVSKCLRKTRKIERDPYVSMTDISFGGSV